MLLPTSVDMDRYLDSVVCFFFLTDGVQLQESSVDKEHELSAETQPGSCSRETQLHSGVKSPL